MISSQLITSLTAHAQMDTLVDTVRQVGREEIPCIFFFAKDPVFIVSYGSSAITNVFHHTFFIIFIF